nr:heat-inducible transcriptional repressor [Candidatus Cloacimonadota bacterium]
MKKNQARLYHTLEALVDEYIQSCEPVSSRILSEKYLTDVSSATLRLDLLKLEEQNLISQPHVSAGRVPTISGYRKYLEYIEPDHKNVTYDRMDTLRNLLIENYNDTPRALHYVMQVLAHETDQLSFVAEPEVSSGFLSRLEVFSISEGKLIFVMSLDSKLDKTVIMKCSYEINDAQLKKLVRYLNDELVGLRVYDIANKVLVDMRERVDGESDLLSQFLVELHKAFIEISDFYIHYDGSIKFLEQPEFDSKEVILSFMNLMQRQDYILNAMRAHDENTVNVLMGEDFSDPRWYDFALIYSRYEVFGIPGYLGVLTPLRAEYRKLIPLMRDVSKTITQTTQRGMVVPRGRENE